MVNEAKKGRRIKLVFYPKQLYFCLDSNYKGMTAKIELKTLLKHVCAAANSVIDPGLRYNLDEHWKKKKAQMKGREICFFQMRKLAGLLFNYSFFFYLIKGISEAIKGSSDKKPNS